MLSLFLVLTPLGYNDMWFRGETQMSWFIICKIKELLKNNLRLVILSFIQIMCILGTDPELWAEMWKQLVWDALMG